MLIFVREFAYLLLAMLTALIGSVHPTRLHRWMNYSLALLFLSASIGTFLRTLNSPVGDIILDYGTTPLTLFAVLMIVINLIAMRRKL